MTRFFFAALALASLAACQLTPNTDDESPLLSQAPCPGNQGDAQLPHSQCDAPEQGVIPVEHPAELPQLSLAPEQPTDDLATPVEPVQEDNLWVRIRDQLSFPMPVDKRVESEKRWYLKHPNYMARVNKRAEPFLYHIVTAIEEAGLPMELALLPIVESAYDPFAYSHGRAAGMWQFIPGTATRFGLKQNWWYDGRRDVLAATDAAIDYLTYLHKFFDGNWLHALAAYNSGEGRVRKAIRRNKRLGKATDFWSLDLPKETRAYVPKLLALADILRNAEALGFPWPVVPNKPLTEVVMVQGQIDLALAAELAQMKVKDLQYLNAGFSRWATDPKGPHYLLLPSKRADEFRQALAAVDDNKRLNWVRHQVKPGDNLGLLAQKYHTSIDIIRSMNNLTGNTIRINDHLLIPVALKSLDAYSLSQDERLKATQKRKRGAYRFHHVVQSGDTLWDISRKYHVKLRSLAKWNAMAPTDPLKPGQKLVVWVRRVSEDQSAHSVMRSLVYTVRRGDSLARIASKFKVRISDIEKWNQLNRSNYLQPGQRLKLYVDVTQT